MIKNICVSDNVIKYVEKTISKEFITNNDEKILENIINESLGIENYVSKILSVNSVITNVNNPINSFNLKDVNILPYNGLVNYNDSILQFNNYILVLCLKGSVSVEFLSKKVNVMKTIKRGDCYTFSVLTTNITHILNPNLHLVVISYINNHPFIHYKNIVFSQDNILYEIFSGYIFTLFRLYDNNDKIEEIIIVNGKYYDDMFKKRNDIVSVNSLLLKYGIITCGSLIDCIPNCNKSSLEIIELSLDNKIINNMSEYVRKISLYSKTGKKFTSVLLYGIICHS
ncbi:concanavalin-like precursor [Brazilian porcupinepox virus 1]|nr:concanavalin-like precursor [Brazilian porcupinepox virus 1]